MKLFLKALASLALLFLIGFGAVTIYFQNMPDVIEVNEFQGQFEAVSIGDSEEAAIAVLGAPNSVETEFRLGQKEGFENAYERAEASNSIKYLVYFRGIDVVFSVGINPKGLVSLKESGGT